NVGAAVRPGAFPRNLMGFVAGRSRLAPVAAAGSPAQTSGLTGRTGMLLNTTLKLALALGLAAATAAAPFDLSFAQDAAPVGEVGQSSLPTVSGDVSLLGLFWQAHFVVKFVMLGLLVCSVWVWAIAIDKWFLFARTKRAMDRFEQAFWSGQSIEELYRTLSAKPAHSMAGLFVAAMREWKRSFETQTKSFAGLQMRIEKVMDVSIAREVERLERRLLVLATVGSAGP